LDNIYKLFQCARANVFIANANRTWHRDDESSTIINDGYKYYVIASASRPSMLYSIGYVNEFSYLQLDGSVTDNRVHVLYS
jgi:hypothetical protein